MTRMILSAAAAVGLALCASAPAHAQMWQQYYYYPNAGYSLATSSGMSFSPYFSPRGYGYNAFSPYGYNPNVYGYNPNAYTFFNRNPNVYNYDPGFVTQYYGYGYAPGVTTYRTYRWYRP